MHAPRLLNAHRFALIGEDSDGSRQYAVGGYVYDTSYDAWRKLWAHLSITALQFVIGPPCDIRYARTSVALT